MTMSSPSSGLSNTRQNLPGKKSHRFGTAFKKVGHYLQNQAHEQSHSALYLAPPTHAHLNESHLDDDDLLENLKASQLAQPYGVIQPLSSDDETSGSSASMATNDATGPGIFQAIKRHQYAADNILQSYDVLIPPRSQSALATTDESGVFVVFIHGGYFRDPKITSTCFKPSISTLESQTNLSDKITGYASLNYRLSPHPAYPQDPSKTPAYTLNNARWPEQPTDVLSALSHLQSTYPISKRYILAGHSVGASLAFQTVLRASSEQQQATTTTNITLPQAIIGVSGIYDFPWIHSTNPDYEAMTKNAMDETYYNEASAALYDADQYRSRWTIDGKNKRVVVLAHSHTDGLVNWDQVTRMQSVFCNSNNTNETDDGNGNGNGEVEDGFNIETITLKGAHYQILENGELARSIERAVELVGV